MPRPISSKTTPRPVHPARAGSVRFRFALKTVVLVVFCQTLTGCTSLHEWFHNGFKVGPNYQRPPAVVSDVWMEATDPRVSSDGSDFADWWSVFNDPVLDGLILNAYQQNLTLREAGLRVLEAQYERAIACGNLFPQVQKVNGEFTRSQISQQIVARFPKLIAYDQWGLAFNASWEMDIWGRFRRLVEAADAQLDASVNEYESILTSLIAEVAVAYVEIRTAQQQLQYTRANVAIQEQSLKLTEIQYDAGSTDQVSVEFARANLEETRALVPELETRLRQSANRLCLLLGVPPRELGPILGVQPVPVVPAHVTVGIPADLIRQRPDIRAAERLVAFQSAQIGIAESELYPAFYLSGTLALDSNRLSQLFSSNSVGGTVGPAFQWNVLNYGRLTNNVGAYEARFQQAVTNYQQTVLGAAEEVENSLTGFLNAQDQFGLFQQSTDANLKALDLVTIQFKEGEIDFTPVYVLQNKVVSQQIELADAQANIALQLISLYKALGGGWQIRCYLDRKCGVITDGFEGIPQPPSGPVSGLQDTVEELPIPGEGILHEAPTAPDPQGNPDVPGDLQAPGDDVSIRLAPELSEADVRRLATELLKQLGETPRPGLPPVVSRDSLGPHVLPPEQTLPSRPGFPEKSWPEKTPSGPTVRVIDHRDFSDPAPVERLSDRKTWIPFR